MVREGTAKWVGYSLCYVVLVLFTLFFSWTYLKRVLYMAFLTIIAPLVAMTYPIDKITDGKAQAFDAWLKEYIFNLLIQPLHLLLYAILVSSAFELATKSPLYALVAVGFMMPAEKLLRRFFGFEKAKTPGLLGGAAGAAMAMSGMQRLLKPRTNTGKNDSGNSKDQNKVKFSNKNNVDIMGAVAGEERPTSGGNVGGSSENSSSNGGVTNPSSGGALDDDDDIEAFINGTTLGSEGWDHGEFVGTEEEESSAPLEPLNQGNPLDENIPQISTSAPSNVASAANLANNRRGRRRSIRGAAGAVLASTGRQLAGRVLRGFRPLKWAGQLALGATAATAGLLLGVASGDPTKAFQYATGGAMAGNAMAKSLSEKQLLDTQKLKEAAKMGYYGEEYKSEVIKKQRKEFQRDTSNIDYLRQTMGVGNKEAKEILNTTGGLCFDNGITSVEDIAAIHKLTNGEDAISFNQAVAARNYAKKRLPSNPDQMTADTKAEYIKRWRNEYQRAGYENAEDLANKAFELAIRFNKAQSGLTKN